ncbi:hypothetical protein CDAR_284861 [Caerostris darwini]|uniref:Uncharacterized protein n=1 Tax=Caerostris darwini TaxID=1538125 RepID=A0AAV4UJK3_9ARAC|nr:hypothetical protein CDAR_284861 [Caerostris darwini]
MLEKTVKLISSERKLTFFKGPEWALVHVRNILTRRGVRSRGVAVGESGRLSPGSVGSRVREPSDATHGPITPAPLNSRRLVKKRGGKGKIFHLCWK